MRGRGFKLSVEGFAVRRFFRSRGRLDDFLFRFLLSLLAVYYSYFNIYDSPSCKLLYRVWISNLQRVHCLGAGLTTVGNKFSTFGTTGG